MPITTKAELEKEVELQQKLTKAQEAHIKYLEAAEHIIKAEQAMAYAVEEAEELHSVADNLHTKWLAVPRKL